MNTMQQEFDAVVNHLYAQGRPAIADKIGCAYRGNDGTMCAVGCRIPDAMYKPVMEGVTAASLLRIDGIELPPEITAYNDMFRALQHTHDEDNYYTYSPDCLSPVFDLEALGESLKEVADEFGLTFTKPQ